MVQATPNQCFFCPSYAIAWAIWIAAGLLAPHLLPVMSLLGDWAPTASAILLKWIIEGRAGVRALLLRVLRWRVGLKWYAVAMGGVVLIGASALALHVTLGDPARLVHKEVPPLQALEH